MPTFKSFEEIESWQKARELTREVYTVSNQGAFAKDFGLRDQIRRASVSIIVLWVKFCIFLQENG